MVLVTAVMVPWEKVVCCLDKEELEGVASLILNHKISSVVVVNPEKSKVLGIMTKTDLINAFLMRISPNKSVGKLMSSTVVYAHEKDGRDKVGQMMLDNEVHQIIIQNDKKEPVGLVTSMDIVRNLVEESKMELGRLLMSIPKSKPVTQ
eukprot:gene3326-5765_t